MKQRIKELMLEVGLVSYGEESGFYNIPVPAFNNRMERFADLIVRECADLYNHEDVLAPIGMSARGEAHQHGWIEGTQAYRDTILKHFGVAE